MKVAGKIHERFMEQMLPKQNHKLLRGDSQQNTCVFQYMSDENQAEILCQICSVHFVGIALRKKSWVTKLSQVPLTPSVKYGPRCSSHLYLEINA